MPFQSRSGKSAEDSLREFTKGARANGTDALLRAALILEANIKNILLSPGRGRLRQGGIDRAGKGSFRTVKGVRKLVRRGVARTNIDLTNRASAPGDPPAPDSGTLQRSITHEVDGNSVRVGTNIEYACIYGANASVTVEGGVKSIGSIRVGDRVLTATGEFRAVTAVSRFPVSEKPDLVTLRVPWRDGKDHILTVTTDHKVAVQRAGRVLWVAAGSIEPGDEMFRRRKVAHNLKAWKCETCDETAARSWGRGRYCWTCARAVIAAAHVGRKRSDETRAKQSAVARSHPVNHLAAIARRSAAENNVARWLDDRGVSYTRSAVFGRRYVDFWLPDTHEVIEADGAYWHRDQRKDVERDRALLDLIPGARITHLHFYDPRWTPILDPQPIPGVRYEVVNPSASSFVEPDAFESMPVSVEHWTWKPAERRHPQASKIPNLYDLAVEGVHSFMANGMLVSNSALEFGTTNAGRSHNVVILPRPFMRPAFAASKELITEAVVTSLKRGSRRGN